MRALPVREDGETIRAFAARLDAAWSAHLDGCHSCNYDDDCMACAADGDGGHSCNCSYEHSDNGYGFKLLQLREQTRAELMQSERVPTLSCSYPVEKGQRGHWDGKAGREVHAPRVDTFLAEIIEVCRKHGLSISHEDGHGAFEVCEFNEHCVKWLLAAHIGAVP